MGPTKQPRAMDLTSSFGSNRSKHCHGVRYLRYLRDQSLETSSITRGLITTAFARALAIQLHMGTIDSMRKIEEMAVLCRELLRLDASNELLLVAAEMTASPRRPFITNPTHLADYLRTKPLNAFVKRIYVYSYPVLALLSCNLDGAVLSRKRWTLNL